MRSTSELTSSDTPRSRHTNWLSRDQFALQYSHFVYGREVYVASGFPAVDNPSLTPDNDVFSLSVTFWW